MKNSVEIYLDHDNNPVVQITSNGINSMYETATLTGKDAYDFIDELSKHTIRGMNEDCNKNYVKLEFSNLNLTINNYVNILSSGKLENLMKNVDKYYRKHILKKHMHKKVTRKNKYSLENMLFAGITLIIMTTSMHSNAKKKENYSDYIPKSNIGYETSVPYDSEDELRADFMKAMHLTQDTYDLNDTDENKIVEGEAKQFNISIDYSDRSSSEKANFTRTSYGNLINKYAQTYGLDPKLVTAIATQERGVHSSVMDKGGATGIMQIQNSVWIGNKLSAYNFDTNSVETITVDSSKISNVETNIKIGCMVLQNTLQYMDYNILAAIQCYNMGYGNMKKILTEYSSETNKSVDEVLNNNLDYGWLNHRDLVKVGDKNYVENVLSWIGPNVDLKVKKPDGNFVNINVDNQYTVAKVNK